MLHHEAINTGNGARPCGGRLIENRELNQECAADSKVLFGSNGSEVRPGSSYRPEVKFTRTRIRLPEPRGRGLGFGRTGCSGGSVITLSGPARDAGFRVIERANSFGGSAMKTNRRNYVSPRLGILVSLFTFSA